MASNRPQHEFARTFDREHYYRGLCAEVHAAEAEHAAWQQTETDWDRRLKQLFIEYVEDVTLQTQGGPSGRQVLGKLSKNAVGMDPFEELENTAIESNRRGKQRDLAVADLQQNQHQLDEKNRQIAVKDQAITEYQHQMISKDRQETEYRHQISQKDGVIAQKDGEIAQKDRETADKDRLTAQLKAELENVKATSTDLEERLVQSDRKLETEQEEWRAREAETDKLLRLASEALRIYIIEGFSIKPPPIEDMVGLPSLEKMIKEVEELMADQ